MSLSITAVYTAIFGILLIPLSMQITLRRVALGNVAVGDANDNDLMCKRETLRNFSEYVPLGLILLAVYENSYGSTMLVAFFGGIFLFSRILHALAFQFTGSPKLFGPAMMLQHGYFSVVGIIVLYNAIKA